jgi:hypothetical protein
MKRSATLAFIAIILLIFTSCSDRRNNNIKISQASTFDRRLNRYAVETKLSISNRFGFSKHISIWEDETNYKSDVADLLKMQRTKADSVCRRYK